MTTPTRRTMGAADAMWLHTDRPNHLMVIDGIMWTEQRLDWSQLRATLQERLVDTYPVFGQRPVDPVHPWELPSWEDDPDFALSHHLHRARLRKPGGEKQLRSFLEKKVSRPLDRSRPLWEAWLVDGYGEGSVLFLRLHHAMADGMALAQVMLTLTDPAPDARDEPREVEPANRGWSVAARATGLVRSALSLPSVPLTMLQAVQVSRKLVLGVLPRTLLSGEPGVDKLLAWSRPLPLADVKAIGRETGSTVNDVLMAALSGALARYLASFGEAVDHLTTMVPVNIRPPGEPLPRELGNKFALVLLHLPTGDLTVAQRLAEVHRRMEQIKHSPEVFITSAVADGIGFLHAIDKPLVDFFAGKAIGVTTNVMGPKEPRFLAGVEVKGVLGWVPGSGGQTLGVCVLSYADTVRIGFKVDAASVPVPDQLIAFFEAELDALRALVPERAAP
ncbi:wax ester/triacylglycerol synthase family O-acyltransferase [Knoellia aerolata]|nr:wax ester/triacylglycerol synthase family O-acyltransferase [Knoellia aerolata]